MPNAEHFRTIYLIPPMGKTLGDLWFDREAGRKAPNNGVMNRVDLGLSASLARFNNVGHTMRQTVDPPIAHCAQHDEHGQHCQTSL